MDDRSYDRANELGVAGQRMMNRIAGEKGIQVLKECETECQMLLEVVTDAIFLVDSETGRLVEVNPACEALYGYTREQLLHMKDGDLCAEHCETRHVGSNGDFADSPYYHKRKDGSVFPVETESRLLLWQGRQVKLVAICDVSSRIAAHKEKAELQARLIQFQKTESIGALAGEIAHDFNNILSAIIGYGELGMIHTAESNPARLHLHEILKTSRRAKALIGQILAFSRQDKSEPGPVKLGVIINETIEMLRVILPASINIDADIATDSSVMADGGQMQQVFMNLCTNAYHAMKISGGRLQIELTETPLNDAAALRIDLKAGDYLRLVVSDTGVGISQNIQRRIFEPYFTTKEKGEGSGLGLSTAIGIIKSHGGTITVKSKPGDGSCFFVYLPKLICQTTAPAAESHDNVTAGSECELCIDDEPPVEEQPKDMSI